LAAAVLAVSPAGCGGGDGGDGAAEETAPREAAEPVTFELAEEHNSDQSGTATFTPAPDGAIPTFEAVVRMTPATDASLPAHIHNVNCAAYATEIKTEEEIEASIESALTDVRNGESRTTVPGSLDELTTGDYSINVHDPAKGFETIACGDIPSS
jgi:hypothetical protein